MYTKCQLQLQEQQQQQLQYHINRMSTQDAQIWTHWQQATSAATSKWKQIYDFDHEFLVCVCVYVYNSHTIFLQC